MNIPTGLKSIIIPSSLAIIGLSLGTASLMKLRKLIYRSISKDESDLASRILKDQVEKYDSRYVVSEGGPSAILLTKPLKNKIDSDIRTGVIDETNYTPIGDVSKGVNGYLNLPTHPNKMAPEILAHELGHAHYIRQSGGKVGNLVHSESIAMLPGYFKFAILIILGIAHGATIGDKVDPKLAGFIAALSTMGPAQLIREFCASKKAMDFLRESGASESQLSESRKSLVLSFGPYLGGAIFVACLAYILYLASYHIGTKIKKRYKAKNEDKDNDSDDTKNDERHKHRLQ